MNHFEYRYLREEEIVATTSVNKLMNKYKNVVIIGGNSYYHKLIRDEKIGYLDLVNEGNWGYNGKDKMIKEVDKVKKNTTFFVTKLENKNTSQTDQDLIAYIKNHGKKIEDTKYYEIYQIKDR